ncbi:MAG: CPBP family intramembrane metalloprotease [Balneolaceae bacterium]|nr:MAG: CPBP family intramembrane metalloprotease [Balneolaceae bacterium]
MAVHRTDHNGSIDKIRERFSEISITKAFFIALFSLIPFGIALLILNFREILTGFYLDLSVSIVIYLIPLALIVYAFSKKELNLLPILKSTGQHARDMIMVVPLILFSISVIWVTILLLSLASSDLAQGYLDFLNSIEMLETTSESPLYHYLLLFIGVAILPSLFEELVFRGAMVERFGRKHGFKTGVILSSVLFGILHVDVVGAIFFGVILSLIYLKTSSLFLPILIHLINNGLVVVFIFLDDQFLQIEPWKTTEPFITQGWLGVVLFIASSVWIYSYLKKNWYLVHEKEPIGRSVAEAAEST